MAVTVYWDPSPDTDVKQYELQSAATINGPWSDLATVLHAIPGAAYDGTQFSYAHAAGSLSTWYRLRVQDQALQYSGWTAPFQPGSTDSEVPTTDLGIVQDALGELGSTAVVTSLTAPVTKEELVAAKWYPRVRRALLGLHDWKFARRRAVLALLTDHERSGWSFCYALPGDHLKPVDLDLGWRGGPTQLAAAESDTPTPPGDARPRFDLEANNYGTGRILCTDIPDAVLVYTADIQDPSVWSPEFQEAVIFALAARMAMPVTGKADLGARLVPLARDALAVAVAEDLKQQRLDPLPDSSYIAARSW